MSLPINSGPVIPWLRRYSQMAWVMARICASVNVAFALVPRCPLVPKLTSWLGSARIGLFVVERSFQPADVDQEIFRCEFACVRMCSWGE